MAIWQSSASGPSRSRHERMQQWLHATPPQMQAWYWQAAAQHAAWTVARQPPPPPPPPPPPRLADSSQSESESEGSASCDDSGIADGQPSSVLPCPRSPTSLSEELATEARLETLRTRLQNSMLFASARRRLRDAALQKRLAAALDADGEQHQRQLQVERRAAEGFASLDQVAAASLAKPTRKTVKALPSCKVKLEFSTETVATAVHKRRRRPRGGRRGGRNKATARKSDGALPMRKLKATTIPKWQKPVSKGKGKGKSKRKGLVKGKGKTSAACSQQLRRQQRLREQQPQRQRTPNPRTMRQRIAAASTPPRVAKPSARPRPSQSVTVTLRL